MITYHYRSLRDEKVTVSDAFRTGALIVVETPTPDELKLLETRFKLDPDLLADALDPDEIPRIDTDDDILYIYMRYSYRRGDVVETDPVLLVVAPTFVAAVSRRHLTGLDRMVNSPQLFTTQRAKLLLLLLRHLVLSYEANINFLDRQIRGVRARLNVATINNRDFVQFVVIEDALNSFLAELVPANLLLSSLLSGRYALSFHEEDRDLIEDLVQATRQLGETSQSSLRTVVNIREAYSNIMTNNLNRRVELLTSLTVVLTIPTIIFSLFGVNVPVPGGSNSYAFAILAASTILIMAAALYWLYRRRWL
jgi:magnesium transporter